MRWNERRTKQNIVIMIGEEVVKQRERKDKETGIKRESEKWRERRTNQLTCNRET